MKKIILSLLLVSLIASAFATAAKKQVVINLTSPTGSVDETTVYFDFGVTPAFIVNQDAPKVFGNIAGVASIYTLSTDNVICSINGYGPLTVSAVIPVGIKADTTGSYLFTATMLSNFDSTTIVEFEDRQENIFINLRSGFYTAQIADTGIINGRFFIHVSRAIQVTTIAAGCSNNSGSFTVNEDSTVVWGTVNLFDSSGNNVAVYNNISGPFSFTGLPEGDYTVILFYQGYYASAGALHVSGSYVVAHIQPLPLMAEVNQDVTFHAIAENASNYFWDFGDGSQINGIANPTYAFLQPGTFRVLLVSSNAAGCQYSDSVTITVTTATAINNIAIDTRKVWASSKTITAVLNEDIQPGSEIKIYNLLGQPVYHGAITQLTTVVTLNNEPNGYYIVSLQNNQVTSSLNVLLMQ